MGSEVLDRRRIPLDPSNGAITIGRSGEATHQIGSTLGEWARGIARIQATIYFEGEFIFLVDGTKERPSTNGIWVHGDKVEGAIALVPGLELTLFKSGRAKVAMTISDGKTTDSGNHNDTYTGEDLTSILQEQIESLKEQGQKMSEQITALAAQLAQREAIDEHQEQTIAQMSKTTKRILSSILGLTAALILGSGYAKDLSASDRQQWISLLLSVALGGSAVYVQKAADTTGAR